MSSILSRKSRSSMICSTWPNASSTRSGHKIKVRGGSFTNESSFICGTVKTPLGSNVVVAEKSRVLNRISKKDSALQRHFAWLRELQENKKRLDEDKRLEEERKSERIRLLKVDRFCTADSNKQLASPPSEETASTVDSSSVAKQKPAWCNSEDAQNKAEKDAEVNDENELLAFVDNLNFEQYNEDLELQTLMSQVKERIKSLQKEKKNDETRLQTCVDSENAAVRAEALDKHSLVDLVPSELEVENDDDDAISIACSVMSAESTIKSIHSRKSVAALVSRAKERMASQTQLSPIEEGEKEVAMPPPISITIQDDDGARMRETKSLNKLAFKNRNPAL